MPNISNLIRSLLVVGLFAGMPIAGCANHSNDDDEDRADAQHKARIQQDRLDDEDAN